MAKIRQSLSFPLREDIKAFLMMMPDNLYVKFSNGVWVIEQYVRSPSGLLDVIGKRRYLHVHASFEKWQSTISEILT